MNQVPNQTLISVTQRLGWQKICLKELQKQILLCPLSPALISLFFSSTIPDKILPGQLTTSAESKEIDQVRASSTCVELGISQNSVISGYGISARGCGRTAKRYRRGRGRSVGRSRIARSQSQRRSWSRGRATRGRGLEDPGREELPVKDILTKADVVR